MKKNLVLLLIAVCLSSSAFAQITWNARLGMNMTNFTKIDDAKMKIGYSISAGMDYAFTDMWSIQPSLVFNSKGAKNNVYRDNKKIKETYTPNYLDIPILAAAKFNLAENTRFVVNAGPYFGFGLGGKLKVKAPDQPDASYKLFTKAAGSDEAIMKRFDFGLQFGVGVEYGHLLANLTGMFGFISPFKDGYIKDTNGDKISPKNIGFNISVGYRF